ncbi:MAG: (5-formylfuran-3-yl)methyl phosphate synthase [Candidatus Omnitrophica bacterium]|nr:(5-formylfuran-3-yl)methyl phosphate synthase [Candidatus Omnitrophota bacterium]
MNYQEAKNIIGNCDILDIKNPLEGSLGANLPWIIKEIVDTVPKNQPISIAIGDVPNLPGTISLSVLGALRFKPDYIKIGLKGLKTKKEAINLMSKVVKTVRNFNPTTKIVAVGYADYKLIKSIHPLDIPDIAKKSGADAGMLDTAIKNGKTLLNIMSTNELKEFVASCRAKKLLTALAGSLDKQNIKEIKDIGAEIFGVRGAVCLKKERTSHMSSGLAKNLYRCIKAIH